mgnify:CR=1 FL=1
MKEVIVVGGTDTIFEYLGTVKLHITLVQYKEKITEYQISKATKIILIDEGMSYGEILEQVRLEHSRRDFDVILTMTENCVDLCSKLKDDLKIEGISKIATSYVRDKYKMRLKFKELGIPTMNFLKVRNKSELKKFYDDCELGETILKPLSGAASEGIVKISSKEDIDSAWSWADDSTKELLVEEFIDGTEYSAEGVFINGKHRLLAITKKYTTGDPHFIETTHVQPYNLSKKYYKKVELYVKIFFESLGIHMGSTHTEFKIFRDEVYIIETHTRYGGDRIWELLLLTKGISQQNTIFAGIAQKNADNFPVKFKIAASVFAMSKKGGNIYTSEQLTNLKKIKGFYRTDLDSKYYPVRELKSSYERIGYVIVGADNFEELQKRILKIKDILEIE